MRLNDDVVLTNIKPVYTPVVERESITAAFTVEVLQVSGTSPSLAIDVEHKNHDEASWAVAGSFTALTAVGTGAKVIKGLKEQVRLALTMSGTGGLGPDAWMRVVVYPPLWQ